MKLKKDKITIELKNERQIEAFFQSGWKEVRATSNSVVEGTPLQNLTEEEIRKYAKDNNIDLGQASSLNGIVKKILEAEKVEE